MDQSKWKENMQCPVCGKSNLAEEFDVCKICFWENDPCQYENPEFIGANKISLNNYKKWWNVLETIMPKLTSELKIIQPNEKNWKYDNLIIPRENIEKFIEQMTRCNIEVRLCFYNWADKFGYDKFTFSPFPSVNKKTVKETNDEMLKIIFTNDPMNVCKLYGLKQVAEILKKSKDIKFLWETTTPYVSIVPNPKFVPNEV